MTIERHPYHDEPGWMLDGLIGELRAEFVLACRLVREAAPADLAAAIALRTEAHRALRDRMRDRRIVAAGTVTG